MQSKILVAAVGAALMFCSLQDSAQAKLFKRLRANTTTSNCKPGDACYRPTGSPLTTPVYQGGQTRLTINPKGGFEGQLPDSYYAQYAGQRAGTATVAAAPVAQPTVPAARVAVVAPAAAVPTVSVAVSKVPDQKALTLEDAQQLLEKAQADFEAARVVLEKAGSNQKRDATIAAVEAEAQRQLELLAAYKASQMAAAEIQAKIRAQEIEQQSQARQLELLKAQADAITAKASTFSIQVAPPAE